MPRRPNFCGINAVEAQVQVVEGTIYRSRPTWEGRKPWRIVVPGMWRLRRPETKRRCGISTWPLCGTSTCASSVCPNLGAAPSIASVGRGELSIPTSAVLKPPSYFSSRRGIKKFDRICRKFFDAAETPHVQGYFIDKTVC